MFPIDDVIVILSRNKTKFCGPHPVKSEWWREHRVMRVAELWHATKYISTNYVTHIIFLKFMGVFFLLRVTFLVQTFVKMVHTPWRSGIIRHFPLYLEIIALVDIVMEQYFALDTQSLQYGYPRFHCRKIYTIKADNQSNHAVLVELSQGYLSNSLLGTRVWWLRCYHSCSKWTACC